MHQHKRACHDWPGMLESSMVSDLTVLETTQEAALTSSLQSLNSDDGTLLRELNLRMKNGLLSSINTVTAATVRSDNPDVRVALGNVVELLQHQADVHRVLSVPDSDGLIDAAEYIRKLGLAVSRCTLQPIGIRLALAADTLPLEAKRCWRLALAVHELIANAAKHARFDGRDGAIKVKLSLTEPVVNCIVADNGSLSQRLKPGQGLKIVRNLAKDLGGSLEYGFGEGVSSFPLVFPLTQRERRANHPMAKRRAEGMRRRKIATLVRQLQPAGQPSDVPSSSSQQRHVS